MKFLAGINHNTPFVFIHHINIMSGILIACKELHWVAQVYWFAKRGELEKCGEAMMTLVLNEFLEFLVFSQQLPTS